MSPDCLIGCHHEVGYTAVVVYGERQRKLCVALCQLPEETLMDGWLFRCLRMIPERANITEYSKKYVEYGRAYITRLSRKSPYYMNMEGKIKHTWGNNITASVIFYEYLHNEYRRTFVEVHGRFCDIFYKNRIVGTILEQMGAVCPTPAGEHLFFNKSMPLEQFHFQLPFHKFRAEAVLTQTDTKEVIGKAYLTGVFKE